MARTPRSVRSALKILTCASWRAIPRTDEPKERCPLCPEKRGTQQRQHRKPQQQHRRRANLFVRASWGAALRFGAVESQDESPCGAIHKQCACHIKTNSTAMLVSLRTRRTARRWLCHVRPSRDWRSQANQKRCCACDDPPGSVRYL